MLYQRPDHRASLGAHRTPNSSLTRSSSSRRARVIKKRGMVHGAVFLWRTISAKRLSWLIFWRCSAKVSVSDPARTLLDLLTMPESGGIDQVAECQPLRTKEVDSDLLIRYADQLINSTTAPVFKRLGFVADTRLHDHMLVQACRQLPYNRLRPARS
jgi:predicted transcriptional regulator of viral defense system